MIPDKAPGGDVFHAGGDLKKEAHVPSFEKYKEMYMKSIENPDGKWRYDISFQLRLRSLRERFLSVLLYVLWPS